VAKRRSSKTRSRSASQPPSTRNDAKRPPEKIRLKPVLQQIEVSLAQLKKLALTPRVEHALKQLEQGRVAIAAICTSQGCGPDMAFPPDA